MKRLLKAGAPSGGRNGVFLLGLSNWIRSQSWWRAIHRYFPRGLRGRLSAALTTRALERTRFPVLPRVEKPRQAPSDASVCADEVGQGAAGVNIFAYLRGQFGLGESARLYARALLAQGYPVALHDIDLQIPHSFDDDSLDRHIGTTAPYGVSLIFVNPDYFSQALQAIGRAKMEGRYIIACWFWELETIPEEWRWALEEVDEIMVASRFIEQAFQRATDKPVFRVPLPVSALSDSGLSRADFGLAPDKFIFMNAFDYNSWLDRKNPFAVVEAFQQAFPNDRDDVQLLLKSSNGHRHPDKLHRLLAATVGDSRILVRDEVIDRAHVNALHRCVDAYVSLHRAEGFGLGLAECMAMGKPVIATGWSGNLDFMTSDNSCLVDYRLVPVGPGQYPHAEGARWAEADIAHAAAHMRRLVDEDGFAAGLGERAAKDVGETLCQTRAAQVLIGRLLQLAGRTDVHQCSANDQDAAP